jgi:phosphatidylglycerol:prolipoprotein diacylglycerol transferase
MDWHAPLAAVDFAALDIPRAISLGSFDLRFYSLAYIVGILLAWWWVLRLLRAPHPPAPPATREQVDALVTWATLGVILGGRLAYVLFYDLARFAANPVDILKIWEGGMAFHGGMVGVGVAILLYCRSQGISWLRVTDYVACAAPVGLGLGRIANFINGELWGRPTGSDWGVVFPGAGPEPRHPSQLYQAFLEGLVLFVLMNLLFRSPALRARPGFLMGAFLFLYGLFRFVVEFFREPDAQLGVLSWGLTMGQTLCVPMLLGGAWLMATSESRRERAALAAPARG